MGLPAVKEFGEPSTKLEFDRFDDDITVDVGQPEGKSSDQQPGEGNNGFRAGEDSKKGEVSEQKPKKNTKPPTVDEYQWQWKVCNLVFNSMLQYINRVE